MTWLDLVQRVKDEFEAIGIEDMEIESVNIDVSDADVYIIINDTLMVIRGKAFDNREPDILFSNSLKPSRMLEDE